METKWAAALLAAALVSVAARAAETATVYKEPG